MPLDAEELKIYLGARLRPVPAEHIQAAFPEATTTEIADAIKALQEAGRVDRLLKPGKVAPHAIDLAVLPESLYAWTYKWRPGTR